MSLADVIDAVTFCIAIRFNFRLIRGPFLRIAIGVPSLFVYDNWASAANFTGGNPLPPTHRTWRSGVLLGRTLMNMQQVVFFS